MPELLAPAERSSSLTGCWYQEQTLFEGGRFTNWFTRRQLQIDAAKRREAGMDTLSETAPRGARRFFAERGLKDAPGFGLHGVSMLRRADAQPLLYRLVDIADRQHCHRCCSLPYACIVL